MIKASSLAAQFFRTIILVTSVLIGSSQAQIIEEKGGVSG